jgi:hypothetical protein
MMFLLKSSSPFALPAILHHRHMTQDLISLAPYGIMGVIIKPQDIIIRILSGSKPLMLRGGLWI